MRRLFYPRRHQLQINPRRSCPPESILRSSNDSAFSHLSQECLKSDSVCLFAQLEVLTRFSGLKESLEIDPSSEMASKGVVRGCASRRFLMGLTEETLELRADDVNDTLSLINNTMTSDKYKIKEIFYHHFYIDHGTETALKCLQDNCNIRSRLGRSGVSSLFPIRCPYFFIFSLLTWILSSAI